MAVREYSTTSASSTTVKLVTLSALEIEVQKVYAEAAAYYGGQDYYLGPKVMMVLRLLLSTIAELERHKREGMQS